MQNWQSEFIAVAAIVGLSIFLRQRGIRRIQAGRRTTQPHQRLSGSRLRRIALAPKFSCGSLGPDTLMRREQ